MVVVERGQSSQHEINLHLFGGKALRADSDLMFVIFVTIAMASHRRSWRRE